MSDEGVNQNNQTEPVSSQKRKMGFFFTLLALVLFICAFGYGYFELLHVNMSLARTVTALQTRFGTVETDFTDMHKSMSDLQQAGQKSAEITQHQEQLINEWHAAQNGDLNKWHLAEAQYFVKLANDHLQFTNNISLAIMLLQRADAELATLPGDTASNIRVTISQDIANLQSLPKVDVNAIYSQLTDIDKQIDQLPLPATPLQADASKPAPVDPNLSWWRAGMNRTMDALKKIVIVRNIGSSALPLVMPDEKIFLYQNLHAELESAIWGLLHQDNTIYQASLMRMQDWIKQYFVQDAEITKTLTQKMTELSKTDVQPHGADLADTLKLFENAPAAATQPLPPAPPAQPEPAAQ